MIAGSPIARRPKRKIKSASAKTLSFTAKQWNAGLCVLLVVATVLLYLPVSGHRFLILDDQDYVTANAHIHEGLSWKTIVWAFRSTEAANWHPLTWLSHALDYQLFGLNPAGHHLDSVLIHALNVVLLFLLLAGITKRTGPSMLVAALFAIHPINVESVAWVAERKNVLSTLFFLLAIVAYGWYAQKQGWRRYLLLAALFAAGLMAKPMVITLPFVLLLLDYWPLERMQLGGVQRGSANASGVHRTALSRLLLEKIPLLFLSAGSAWITLKAQRAAERTLEELPFVVRIENAFVSYGLYLWKMFWPERLGFYPHSVVALPAWQWLLSAAVLISVTAIVIAFRRKRYLPVGWFWFLGTLVPVIGLVQVGEYAMADRYAYVPLIGIFVMIAWSIADLAEVRNVRTVWQVIPVLCTLLALGCITYRQMDFWNSDYNLWSHSLELRESPLTHNALGVALMHPDSAMSQQDLETVGSAQNRMEEARRHFERALELRDPVAPHDSGARLANMARTLNNLGNIGRLQNRTEEARQNSEEALKIYRQLAQENPEMYLPYLAATLNNLGALDRVQNRLEEAREREAEGLQIQRQLAQRNLAKYLPNIAMTLNELGMLAAMQNRMDEARQHYEEALNIDRELAQQSPSVYLPDLAMTLTDFGRLEAVQNRMDDARQHYEEALEIDRRLAEQNPAVHLPDLAMTLETLGKVDQLQNRIKESRLQYQEALSLLQQLSQGDNRYRGEVAKVEASLEEVNKKVFSK